MKTALGTWLAIVVAVGLTANAFAQAFSNDNDGLLDVGEAQGFPADPVVATGSLALVGQNIEDLDGVGLLTSLQDLRLTSNRITSIESGDFDGLTNLKSLTLWQNSIASIEAGAFEGLSSLQSLGLHVNDITSIEAGAFEGLSSLQSLGLHRNKITSIKAGTFQGLNNLQLLQLSDNPIDRVEAGAFDGLSNLQILDLIGAVGIEPNAFRGLKELRTLGLAHRQLTELNLSGATFNNLRPGVIFDLSVYDGFWVSGIESLILDNAELSLGSFNAIIRVIAEGVPVFPEEPGDPPSPLEHVSLVNLSFTDENPSDLSDLLNIPTLDSVRIDQSLFNLYAAELEAFAANAGNTVTIVPEPSTAFLLVIGSIAWMRRRYSLRCASC